MVFGTSPKTTVLKRGLPQKELSSIRELLSNYEELSSTSEVSSLRPRGPAQLNTSPNCQQLSLKLSPMMLLSLSVSDTQPNNHLVCPSSPAAPPPPPSPSLLCCSLSNNDLLPLLLLCFSAPLFPQLLFCFLQQLFEPFVSDSQHSKSLMARSSAHFGV